MNNKLLSDDVVKQIKCSVLCWLATSLDNQPSVSPKEIFHIFDEDTIIIANIASPNSVRGIINNDKVCVSFLDILAQRGVQIYGLATILEENSNDDLAKKKILQDMAGKDFFVKSVIEIKVTGVKPILAPSYQFKKNITEEEMIEKSLIAYNIKKDIK